MVVEPRPHIVCEPLETTATTDQAAVIFLSESTPAILESLLPTGSYSRYSIFCADPVDEVVCLWPPKSPVNGVTPVDRLVEGISRWPTCHENPQTPFPFSCGWIGYLAYEAGHAIEQIACSTTWDVPIPLVQFRLYDHVALFDHESERWFAMAVDWPKPWRSRRPPVTERMAVVSHQLAKAADAEAVPQPTPPPVSSCPNYTRSAYLEKVGRAKRYIEAGDIYEVNLTRRFSAPAPMAPPELYQRLRRANPSSHAAYLPVADGAILSASPELFVDCRHGHVVTRPIKGTRPRSIDPARDSALRDELARSEKDAAELNMIVDLLRNDLGRVCAYGSVNVTDPVSIETHPTVFHRVATIEGHLRDGLGWADLLRASFPGGSITGAPKIRAMHIIDELEPTARGVYCGSIGMIGLDGTLQLSIAIRTMVQAGGQVHVYAGGAIVADSVAADEDAEIHAKAAGMFQAIGCTTDTEPNTTRLEVIAS